MVIRQALIKLSKLSISVFLLSALAVAQGSGKGDAAINSSGQAIPFPSVRICTASAVNQGTSSTPCQPLDTIYTDNTLSVQASNPFFGDVNGNFFFYAAAGWHTVQVCGTGVSCYSYQTLLAPDVNNIPSEFVGAVVSLSCTQNQGECSPASTGVTRLGPNDSICWRNTANTADVCISKNGADQIIGTTSTNTTAANLISASANPAASGVIRLATGDTACWRNNANSSDVCVSKDANDRVNVAGNGLQTSQYQSATANPAASGVVRLAAGDQICFRNAANTADVCLSKNGSDQIVGVSGNATSLTSATANPAATGVIRLAASDTACFRNAANTADICVSKDANDRISFPGASSGNFTSTTANIAASGQIRLAAGDTACFRNAGNTADICISKNASDQIVVQNAQTLTSATANPAASGVGRLAAGDTFCWRNAANTADICISKNGSDAIVVPTLNVGGTETLTGPETFSGDSITGQTKTTRVAVSGSMTGTVTTTVNTIIGEFKAPLAMTARQLDFFTETAVAGCTTSPVYSIVDVTTSTTLISVTATNGTTLVSATGTGTINSGDTVALKVTTGGVGCTNGSQAVWTQWVTTN